MELQNQLKQMAAKAALEYVVEGEYLGVGTGTTVGFFITELATSGKKVKGCVSSSEATTRQLLAYGIPVCDLNDIVDYLPVYIDGCDEIDGNFCMIKGGGGALTREKIVAQASEKFVCIADESKVVKQLGAFPLPLEVIPMAVSSVSRAMEDLGGHPVVRDFITDNGNNIIDVHGLQIEARTSSWSLLKRASKLRSLRRASSLPARLSNQVLLKRSGVENAAPFC